MAETQASELLLHPQLHIGSLQVPAIIVPCIITILYANYKIWQRSRPPRPRWVSFISPIASEKKAAADAENLHQQPEEEKVPVYQRIAGGIGLVGHFFLFMAILVGPAFTGSPALPRIVSLGVPIACLLSMLALYAMFEKGNTRMQAGGVMAAAAGMLIHQEILGHSPPWKWTFIVPISLLALLSWWPGPPHSVQHMYSVVTFLPLMLLAQMSLPETLWYKDSGEFDVAPYWVTLALVSPFFISGAWSAACIWLGLTPRDNKNQVRIHSIREVCRDVWCATLVLLILGFICALMSSFMAITSYATSCIAFRPLVFGGAVVPPSFRVNVGGTCAGLLLMILMLWRSPSKDQWRVVDHPVDVLGWTAAISLALWIVLMAVEQIRAWM